MSSGLIPVTQLNALPLISVSQAQAGTMTVLGGSISRSFSPTQLGISATTTQTVGTKVCLVSNWLDLRGCVYHQFTLSKLNNTAGALLALPACSLTMQTRLGPTDNPSASLVISGSINDAMNAIYSVSSATITFAASNAGDVYRGVWAWGPGMGSGLSYDQAVAIGSNVRFIVSWSTNAVNAGNQFSAWLESSS